MLSVATILSAFAIVFIAELGDKTQLVAFSFTSTSKQPVLILLATASALLTTTVIAAVLGKIASHVVPSFSQYIASGFFIGFGVYILVSRGYPKIRECFVAAVVTQNELVRALPKILRAKGKEEYRILDIVRQDFSHIAFFRHLIRNKKLFADDINEDNRLDGVLNRLKQKYRYEKLSFAEAIHAVIEKEKTELELYELLHRHLDADHHDDVELQDLIQSLAEEERIHIQALESLMNLENGEEARGL